MRTTVTLDPDVEAKLKAVVRERGISFKQAINDAVRRGLGTPVQEKPYRVPARALGVRPGINLDKATQLAAELEDEELIRKMQLRK